MHGWLTMKEAERYTQAARRRRLARNAGQLLVRATNETSPQNGDELPRADQASDFKKEIEGLVPRGGIHQPSIFKHLREVSQKRIPYGSKALRSHWANLLR
jgi:hypothetical protein